MFNPGDQVVKNPIRNTTLQQLVNDLFDNDDIRFTHSYLAKTNVGVLALMDIKENNITRLNNYHGIISDGVHKVELHEERINTLFLGLVNPEDKNTTRISVLSRTGLSRLPFPTSLIIIRNWPFT